MEPKPCFDRAFSNLAIMQTTPRDIRERTFAFATRILALCRKMEMAPGSSRIIATQLLRSGTSIGANLEEAYGSHSRADFIAKTVIAAQEARETHYWIRLISVSGLASAAQLEELEDEANQIVAILTTIILRTRHSTKP